MKDWFRQLAPREQLVLGAGTVLAVLIVGWSFVYRPLDMRSTELSDSVDELTVLLVDLRRAAGLGEAAGGATAGASDGSLLAIVPETAGGFGLSFDSTRLDGTDAIRVSFSDVPFDSLNAWLIELEQVHGIGVETISGISATATPGYVAGQILLARPPS